MYGTRLRIASRAPSRLVSSMRRLPSLSLVFYVAVLPWLETLCLVVTFLITVEIGEMTLVLASRIGYVGQC